MDKSTDSVHIETHLSDQDEVKPQVMGNVKLLQGNETVLVPTPSPDPNGKSIMHAYLWERTNTFTSSQTPIEQLSHSSINEHSPRTVESAPILSMSTDNRTQADKASQIL
jgi:hypothetical protein